MKNLLYILACVFCFCGCRQEDRFNSEGILCLENKYSDEVVVSRSELTQEEQNALKENSKIRIYKGGKLVFKYLAWSDMPSEMSLPVGDDYMVRVTSGDSIPASFTDKSYEGKEDFVINKASLTTVTVNSNIVNTLVKVVFSEDWKNKVKEAKVIVSVDTEGGSLEYPMSDEEPKTGYYICPQGKEYLKYTFSGTSINGRKFSIEGTVNDADGNVRQINSATLYTLTFSPKDGQPEEGNEGGGFFQLVVDEKPLQEKEETEVIYRKPYLLCTNNGEKVDVSKPWTVFVGAEISPVFSLNGSTPLSAATISCDKFKDLGVTKDVIDLFEEEDVKLLRDKDIEVTKTEKLGTISVNFNTQLNEFIKTEGEINFSMTATDTYSTVESEIGNKSSNIEFKIVASNITVEPEDIPRFEIWTSKVTLYGHVVDGRTPSENSGFMYRQKQDGAEGEWITVKCTPVDGKYRQEIRDLKDNTTYQYKMYDGEQINDVVKEFTTEEARQLPNAGFENWHKSGNTWYIFENGGTMFWDSGNKGGSMVGANMTIQGTDYFNKGISAKLVSKEVAIEFAAGNLFIGEFLGTESLTKGILGWGRSWNSRPSALRGYVRYEPKPVTDSRIDDGDDDATIYIAIGDWKGDEYNGFKNWPVIIRTKDPQKGLFNPNPGTYTGDGIIGYGVKDFKKETKGEDGGMFQFEIPIEYRSLEREPKSIIVVASASKYGDYYVGGDGSTMWLDDLELVYGDVELENKQ